MRQVIKKRIIKIIFWIAASVVILFIAAASALQIPYVQTKVVQKGSEIISLKTGFPSSIEYVRINWFDEMLIEGLEIHDSNDSLMIGSEEVLIDFELRSLLSGNNRKIDEVVLYNADVNLRRSVDEDIINITRFVNNLKREFTSPKKKKRTTFSIGKIKLFNSSFQINDNTKDSIPQGFDYNHFRLTDIKGELSDFYSHSDTLDFRVEKLSAREPETGLRINSLSTYYSVSQKAMKFLNIDLSAGRSHIKDTVIFYYNSTENLSSFNDSVRLKVHFDETVLNTADLALFAPSLKNFNESYKVSGIFNGKIVDFNFKDFELSFRNSYLQGSLGMSGLPDFEETFIDANLSRVHVHAEDLYAYFPENMHDKLQKLGQINFNGNLLGFPTDFVAEGDFRTDIGRVISDVNMKISEVPGETQYSGRLKTESFNLGKFLNDTITFQYVDMNGEIEGSGFALENARFNLNGNIDQLGIKRYNYNNITTNASFAKEFFDGKISINDPNLKFQIEGSIDLREKKNLIQVKGNLDTAYLKKLNLSQDDIFIKSELEMNVRGLQIDSIQGNVYLNNSIVLFNDRDLKIDSLELVSKIDNNFRSLFVESSNIKLNFEGNFNYTTIFNDLKVLIHEYKLEILNNYDSIQRYYSLKDRDQDEKYTIKYNIELRNINPLLNLFVPEIHVSQNTTLNGRFTSGYTSIFSLYSNFDTISYEDNKMYDTQIELTTSKVEDSTEILAMAYIFSQSQDFNNITATNDFMFEGIWDKDHIDFNFNFEQEGTDNYTDLYGELDFLKNRTRIRFKDSDIQVLGEKWEIGDKNQIIIAKREFEIENLIVSNQEQQIKLDGYISEDPDKALTLLINNFKLESINPLLERELSGLTEGFVTFNDLYKTIRVESKLNVQDLTMSSFLIGNMTALSEWNNDDRFFDINFFIDRDQKRIVNIEGTYSPDLDENALDLKAFFDKANLIIAEPFLEEIFSDIGGTASGSFTIKGTPKEPLIRGDGRITDGKIRVNYLNTLYTFNGDISLTENSIGFNDVTLRDRNQNTGKLDGRLVHNRFQNLGIDLEGSFTNFLVLNTTSKDNSLFYGTGIVSGSVHFFGALDNMNITANATTNKGTRIFIPIGGAESIEREEFIDFVDFSDTTENVSIEKKDEVDLKGLKLDFDLEITTDAYAEIIFDLKAGDIIRGRGSGNLKLQIDTRGDFSMFGDYVFEEGGYNFTLYNIINKEFVISSGSKISWSGDPYQGVMDINAIYSQLASMAPLLTAQDTSYQNHPDINRRYPTEVILDLEGPLLSPAIDFDIEVKDYPQNIIVNGESISLATEVARFENQIESDEQELKRQVFSLIILRRFSPPNAFQPAGSFGNSVSEFVSNQLSFWITQVDENLEIDVDLGGLDEEAFNAFQLRLSYTFLQGRLRITRAGGFTNQSSQADISTVAGDWTVEYLLTPDGKFRVKMYNRTNYNTLGQGTEGETNTTTAGVSIIHTQSFNELKDLFRLARKKRKKQKEEKDDRTAAINEEDKPN